MTARRREERPRRLSMEEWAFMFLMRESDTPNGYSRLRGAGVRSISPNCTRRQAE